MEDFCNFDSSNIFQLNDHYTLDWDEHEFSDFEIFPTNSQKIDNFFSEKITKIESIKDFEKTKMKKVSFNCDFSEYENLQYKKENDTLSNLKFGRMMTEENLLASLNEKQKNYVEASPFTPRKLPILTNISNYCSDFKNISSPSDSSYSKSGNLKFNSKNIINNDDMEANKLKKVILHDETFELRRKETKESMRKINSYDFTDNGILFNVEKDYTKRKCFKSSTTLLKQSSFDSSKTFLNKKCKSSNTLVEISSCSELSNKLERNRISAQKSRAKKKFYVQSLEEELDKTKEELEYYRNMYGNQQTSIENSMQQMNNKEFKFLEIVTMGNMNVVPNVKIPQLKAEYNTLKVAVFVELLKKIIRNMLPLDLKIFGQKSLKLKDITNFQSMDQLIEIIGDNQSELLKLYNFKLVDSNEKTSLPLNMYLFLEQLKELSKNLREFHLLQ